MRTPKHEQEYWSPPPAIEPHLATLVTLADRRPRFQPRNLHMGKTGVKAPRDGEPP
jgi:hypothetical protein